MKRLWVSLALALSAVLLAVPMASAHTPVNPGNNATLADATVIPDSLKSWAVYAELPHARAAQYYEFDATKGEKVPIELFTSPAEQRQGFAPNFVLIGPGIPDGGTTPSYVESPRNAGRMVFAGASAAHGTYEAFSPSVFFSVAATNFIAPADGTYYVSVFDERRGGRYGIAIGDAERFTACQWITTPLAVSRIYRWEGQNPLLVYLPAFLVLVIGVSLLVRRGRRGRALDLPAWLSTIAGLLFIGSSVTVMAQMAIALMRSVPDVSVIATLALVTLPLVVGVLTLLLALRRSGRWTILWRMLLAALGVVALVVWAGWIVGPVLAAVAALVPSRTESQSSGERTSPTISAPVT